MALSLKYDASETRGTQPPDDLQKLWSAVGLLWKRRNMIAALTAAMMALALLVIVTGGAKYRSEAAIELNFDKDDYQSPNSIKQIASKDPGALVNGAAQAISSRANVSRVVKSLKLDEPDPSKEPILSVLSRKVKGLFGIQPAEGMMHERAIADVLENVKVSSKQHLYVIGIAYTADSPDKAALIANTLALEYLRGERLKELTDKASSTAREIISLSETLGDRHPRLIQARARSELLQSQIAAIRQATGSADKFLLAGQTLTAAEPVLTPVGMKKNLMLMIALAFSLAIAVFLALLAEYFGMPSLRKMAQQASGRATQLLGNRHHAAFAQMSTACVAAKQKIGRMSATIRVNKN